MAKRRTPARNATRKPQDGPRPEREDPWVAAYLRMHPEADRDDVRAMRGLAPAGAASAPDPAVELEDLAEQLRRVDAERLALLERRAVLVERLRGEGRTWADVAALAGVSHSALIQCRRTGQL